MVNGMSMIREFLDEYRVTKILLFAEGYFPIFLLITFFMTARIFYCRAIHGMWLRFVNDSLIDQ
jgi:hypothetical protein